MTVHHTPGAVVPGAAEADAEVRDEVVEVEELVDDGQAGMRLEHFAGLSEMAISLGVEVEAAAVAGQGTGELGLDEKG